MKSDESFNKQIGYPGCFIRILFIIMVGLLLACPPEDDTVQTSNEVINQIESGEIEEPEPEKLKQATRRPPED